MQCHRCMEHSLHLGVGHVLSCISPAPTAKTKVLGLITRMMSCQQMMLLLMTVEESYWVPFAKCWVLSNRWVKLIATISYTKPSLRYGDLLKPVHSLSKCVVRSVFVSLSSSCLYKQDGHHYLCVWIKHWLSKRWECSQLPSWDIYWFMHRPSHALHNLLMRAKMS